ncbi:hypothetical protein Q4489_08760 [Thalassotalea sp. 1_MG-2023]|uniref:hypothetical protein n=1 Tax=Thalassotalea sp. 1_MG-2023 TaxID=3062680 RepID=UPI0026E37ECA|nr:hypothetical protein [Thalassotalea sp. 1_MG-2023]MDO6427100.1 hypothetical protein [Thalassotalea sp. 1_MG-2023]
MKLLPLLLTLLFSYYALPVQAGTFANFNGKLIEANSAAKAKGILLNKLIAYYGKIHNIEVPTQDKAAYLTLFNLTSEISVLKNQQALAELTERQNTRELTEKESKQLKLFQSLSNTPISSLKELTPLSLLLLNRAYINKAMHKEFGGGIIFQQAGLEVPEAWSAFAQEQEALNNLTFINESFKSSFYHALKPKKNHVSYLSSGDEEFPIIDYQKAITEKKAELAALKNNTQ